MLAVVMMVCEKTHNHMRQGSLLEVVDGFSSKI